MMASSDRDLWLQLSPYLDEALDLSPVDRTAWLSSLRAREPLLASRVEAF